MDLVSSKGAAKELCFFSTVYRGFPRSKVKNTWEYDNEVAIEQEADFKMPGDFYCRYYVGHKGKFGHEFLEFEFRPDGKMML